MNLLIDSPPKSQSFVLRIWSENQSAENNQNWRYLLENPETKARYGFNSLNSLLEFLERRTAR